MPQSTASPAAGSSSHAPSAGAPEWLDGAGRLGVCTRTYIGVPAGKSPRLSQAPVGVLAQRGLLLPRTGETTLRMIGARRSPRRSASSPSKRPASRRGRRSAPTNPPSHADVRHRTVVREAELSSNHGGRLDRSHGARGHSPPGGPPFPFRLHAMCRCASHIQRSGLLLRCDRHRGFVRPLSVNVEDGRSAQRLSTSSGSPPGRWADLPLVHAPPPRRRPTSPTLSRSCVVCQGQGSWTGSMRWGPLLRTEPTAMPTGRGERGGVRAWPLPAP